MFQKQSIACGLKLVQHTQPVTSLSLASLLLRPADCGRLAQVSKAQMEEVAAAVLEANKERLLEERWGRPAGAGALAEAVVGLGGCEGGRKGGHICVRGVGWGGVEKEYAWTWVSWGKGQVKLHVGHGPGAQQHAPRALPVSAGRHPPTHTRTRKHHLHTPPVTNAPPGTAFIPLLLLMHPTAKAPIHLSISLHCLPAPRYHFNLNILLGAAARQLKWADGAAVRAVLEEALAALLGPKTEADLL